MKINYPVIISKRINLLPRFIHTLNEIDGLIESLTKVHVRRSLLILITAMQLSSENWAKKKKRLELAAFISVSKKQTITVFSITETNKNRHCIF